MFKNKDKRFFTKGIDTDLSKEVQIVCWKLVDNLVKEKVSEVDCLQIFEFEKNQEDKLVVVHRQEQPIYQKSYGLKLEESIVDFDIYKLWLIDDGVY